MKRRFLALAMTLAMVFSLFPAGVLSISAEPLDVPSCDTIYEIQPGAAISFENATTAGTKMSVGDDNTSLSLNVVEESVATEAKIDKGYDATIADVVNDANERYIVLDMQIDKMPIWVDEEGNSIGPASVQAHSSTGFFIHVRRPEVSEFGEATDLTANNHPVVHLAIVRMDETGNLGFAVKKNTTDFLDVVSLGKTLEQQFELAICWLDDYSLQIYCDDALLVTYNVADLSPLAASRSELRKGIRIGYNSYGSKADAEDGYAVKLNVNSVSFGSKVTRAHTGGNATCVSQAVCEVCGTSYGELGQHTPGKNGICVYCPADGYMDYTQYEISKTDYPLADLTLSNFGTNTAINKDATPVTITQTSLDTDAYAEGTNNHYLTSGQVPFAAASNGFFLIQDIQIDKMPAFTQFIHGNTRTGSGYYVSCPIDYYSETSGREVILLCVYRIDDSNDLYLAAGKSGACGDRYPLGVTLGQRFTLMAHCKLNGNVDVYCNDVLVHTYSSTDFATGASSGNSVFRLGYYSRGADASVAGSETDIKVYGVSTGVPVAHEHDGGQATCTTKAICETCGTEYGNLGAHKPGINGVCTLCGEGGYMDYTQYEISKTDYPLANLTLSNLGTNTAIDTDADPVTITQTSLDTDAYSEGTNNHYLTSAQNPFEAASNGFFLIQDIQIDNMPVYTSFVHGNTRTGSGYYVSCPIDYYSETSGKEVILLCVYRIDGSNDLYLAAGKSGACGERYPLGVTLGQRFTLMAHCKPDGNVDVYCNDVLVHTYSNTDFATGASSGNSVFRLGYYSKGADASIAGSETSIKVYGVSTGVPVAHEHVGGTATCIEQATCEVCGKKYGQTAPHTEDTAASCTTHATCSVCGDEYGVYADHTPNDAGICTECQAETGYLDLLYQYTEEDGTVVNRVTAGKNSLALMSISKYGAAINAGSVDLISSNTPNYTAVIRGAFAGEATAHHISQTVTITAMPAFNGATYVNGYTGTGYYNQLRRDISTAGTTGMVDCAMYSIYPNADGDLMVGVYTTSGWKVESLNRELGKAFRLETVWDTDGSLSIFCDGYLVINVTDATYDGNIQGDHSAALSMGYMSRGAIEESYGTGAVNMSVSNIVISNGHTPTVDDGDCKIADVCSICGAVFNEAKDAHVQADDDDNCVTPVYCGNPGCKYVFVEGHNLIQHEGVAATETEEGILPHWYCTVDGCGKIYADAEGTEVLNSVVIPKLIQVEGEKVTVSEGAMNNAIANAGDNAQVDLTVPGTKVEMPSAALNALDKPLVITTDENGKITLSNEMIAYIKEQAGSNSFSIEVKAGATLSAEQTAQLAGYTAVKDVISAELLIGNAVTSDFEGTVSIEIPFVLDPGTVAGDYMLVYVTDNSKTPVNGAVFAEDKVTVTLEHFSDYAIVYTGELPQEPVVGGTQITQNGGAVSNTVTGSYVPGGAADTTFSVDVEWGNLEFFYDAANTWNPDTHTNDGGGWRASQKGNVKVTNHSNVAVTVTVTKVDVGTNGTNTNLGVDFLDNGGNKVDGDVVTDVLIAGNEENVGELADSFTVEFTPRGELDETAVDGITLATITVRIEKYDEETQN